LFHDAGHWSRINDKFTAERSEGMNGTGIASYISGVKFHQSYQEEYEECSMKKVLIVDDETLILYSLAKTLRKEDIEVNTLATGREALSAIEEHVYDLCMLDIHLPDIPGLDIMHAVNKIAPATKIVIMTANEVDDDMMVTIKEHACLFLAKPFDLFQVRSLVNTILNEDRRDVYSNPNFLT
jgi:two-component system response regulator (stage 0 sporulation protein F)